MAKTADRVHAPRGIVALSVLAALSVMVFSPIEARAELVVRDTDGRSWPAAVAAMQADVNAEGREVQVVVEDETNRRARCGEYTLALDAVGIAAFELGPCDPTTDATHVVLRHRAALFDHTDIVAHPLAVGITAVQTRTTGARGGAGETGGSEVYCSVAVRPFLRDMERGTIVYLTPGRFELRPLATGVTASADPTGWTLYGAAGATLTIEYEVFDTQRHETVLHDRATLACASAPVVANGIPMEPVGSGCANAVPLTLGASVHGSTVGFPDDLHASCGNRALGRNRVYSLQLATQTAVSLRLSSTYDGVLYILSDCGAGAREFACNDDSGDTRHSAIDVTLGAGTYFVVVDGYGAQSSGDFDLLVTTPNQAASTSCDAVPLLALGQAVHGSTTGRANTYATSCGSGGHAPDQTYALRITERSNVALRLSSNYDGVLSVRAACDPTGTDFACNDDGPDVRHSSLNLILNPGTYYVVVDGYGQGAGDFDLTVTVRPERMTFVMDGGGSFQTSGTALGGGFGVFAGLHYRVGVGSLGVRFGTRISDNWYGCERSGATGTLCGNPSGSSARGGSLDVSVLSFGAPIGLDVTTAGSLHTYVGFMPAVLVVDTNAGQHTTALSFATTVGMEFRPAGALGVFVESTYTLRHVDMTGLGTALQNGFGVSAGIRISI